MIQVLKVPGVRFETPSRLSQAKPADPRRQARAEGKPPLTNVWVCCPRMTVTSDKQKYRRNVTLTPDSPPNTRGICWKTWFLTVNIHPFSVEGRHHTQKRRAIGGYGGMCKPSDPTHEVLSSSSPARVSWMPFAMPRIPPSLLDFSQPKRFS